MSTPILSRSEQEQFVYDTLRTTAYREWKNHRTLYDFQVAMFQIAQELIATSPFITYISMAHVVNTIERVTTWTWERFGEVAK